MRPVGHLAAALAAFGWLVASSMSDRAFAQPSPEATAPSPQETRARAAAEHIGPFEIAVGDHSTLGVGIGAQLRLTVDNAGGELGDAGRDTETTAELRRVRWLLRGSFLDDAIKALVQLSTAPGSPEIIDVWAEQRLSPALRLRFGQFRVPFTRHRQQSFVNLALVDWDLAAVRFGAERQLGAMVHDGLRGDGHVTYGAGVFAGPNARASFERGIAEAYAEPLPNPSSLRPPALPVEVHPELVGMLGYSTRGMDLVAPTDLEGGPARLFVAASGAWDARPTSAREFALRFAPEVMLKVAHLTIDAVAYVGLFERSSNDELRPGMVGVVVDLAYRFRPRAELAARYSRADALEDLRSDARSRADGIIAGADPASQPVLVEQYADAGLVRSRQEASVGLNLYIVGRSLAFQTDFAALRTEGVVEELDGDELRTRGQLQLAF